MRSLSSLAISICIPTGTKPWAFRDQYNGQIPLCPSQSWREVSAPLGGGVIKEKLSNNKAQNPLCWLTTTKQTKPMPVCSSVSHHSSISEKGTFIKKPNAKATRELLWNQKPKIYSLLARNTRLLKTTKQTVTRESMCCLPYPHLITLLPYITMIFICIFKIYMYLNVFSCFQHTKSPKCSDQYNLMVQHTSKLCRARQLSY